jgi:DNA-binding GntR family transcriptional regulator
MSPQPHATRPRPIAGTVTPLCGDRLSPARRLAARVEDGIRSGALAPGTELALRELARRHRLKTSALSLSLHGLVREGLLAIRGDVAVVTALSVPELARVRQLRRPLLAYLFERAHRNVLAAQLDACGQVIDAIDPDTAGLVAPGVWVAGSRQFVLGLVGPSASSAERLTVQDLFGTGFRYQALGWRQIAACEGDLLALRREHALTCRSLLDGMRSPRPLPVVQLAGRRDDEVHDVARSSLSTTGLAALRAPRPA